MFLYNMIKMIVLTFEPNAWNNFFKVDLFLSIFGL